MATPTVGAPVEADANAEAVDWFRARTILPASQWRALDEVARRRAFTVAGATELQALARVYVALEVAVAAGVRFSDFRETVGNALAGSWAGLAPDRLETVFRNAMQSAYNAGRYAQLTDPEVLASRPYWRFEAILDSRTSEVCTGLDGTTLPANDPFWGRNYPPLHHRCRSGVVSLSEAEGSAGRKEPPGGVVPQSGWGAAPGGAEWEPSEEGYPPELFEAYKRAYR